MKIIKMIKIIDINISCRYSPLFVARTEKPWTLSRLQSSFHCLIGNHVVGFTCELSIPSPPVSKNVHCDKDSSSCCWSRLIANSKENSSLSFSNKDRQTFVYREEVKDLIRSNSRCSTVSAGSVLPMANSYKFTNHVNEYWYIGSTFPSAPSIKMFMTICAAKRFTDKFHK